MVDRNGDAGTMHIYSVAGVSRRTVAVDGSGYSHARKIDGEEEPGEKKISEYADQRMRAEKRSTAKVNGKDQP